jgi:S-adenosylmethionine decarboxylase
MEAKQKTVNTQLKLGEHYLCELSGCNQALLFTSDDAIAVFLHAIRASGLTVLAESAHKFAPHGFSAYTLLAESHASVHAWPEYGYCAIDVFTCNLQLDLDPLFQRLQRDFGAHQMALKRVDRNAQWQGRGARHPVPGLAGSRVSHLWSLARPVVAHCD